MDTITSHFASNDSPFARIRYQTVSKITIPYDEALLEPGDVVLATPAFGFIPWVYHYAVYVGDHSVVHVQKEGIVKYDLDKFLKKRTKVFIDKLVPLPHEVDNKELMDQRRDLIANTANSMIGTSWKFNAISENCESFTNWVTTGRMHSNQGIAMRNSIFLYGAAALGYAIGMRRARFWRLSWWKTNSNH